MLTIGGQYFYHKWCTLLFLEPNFHVIVLMNYWCQAFKGFNCFLCTHGDNNFCLFSTLSLNSLTDRLISQLQSISLNRSGLKPPSDFWRAWACFDLHSLLNAHASVRASAEHTRGSHRSHSDHTPTPKGKRHNRDTKASHPCLRRRLLSVKVRLNTFSAWWNVGHFFPQQVDQSSSLREDESEDRRREDEVTEMMTGLRSGGSH